MAGLLSRHRHRSLLLLRRPSLSLTHNRHRSNNSGKPKHPHLIEIDLDSSEINGRVRKLDEVIHSIIVRRSAPDWLPFLPGSSYWVPPRTGRGPAGLLDVVGKLTGPPQWSDEETLSFSSVRGWPSSAYYIRGSAHTRPIPVDVQVVEVKLQEDSDSESRSEDEEH